MCSRVLWNPLEKVFNKFHQFWYSLTKSRTTSPCCRRMQCTPQWSKFSWWEKARPQQDPQRQNQLPIVCTLYNNRTPVYSSPLLRKRNLKLNQLKIRKLIAWNLTEHLLQLTKKRQILMHLYLKVIERLREHPLQRCLKVSLHSHFNKE